MSESKELAIRVRRWVNSNTPFFIGGELANALEQAFDALNIAFAPPVVEGSVKVLIAVGAAVDNGGALRIGDSYLIQPSVPEKEAMDAAFSEDDTHRGIVEAWIPRVAQTPTVAGRVV